MCDNRYTLYRAGNTYKLNDGTTVKPQADVTVPCGSCPVCKKNRGMQWAFRLQQEMLVSRTAHFVTLTYNSDTVPIVSSVVDGEIFNQMTLCKEDLTTFWKRLRKYEEEFSYYVVGEYGTARKRPHYHALVFGVKQPNNYAKAWNGGYDIDRDIERGLVHIGDVTLASIIYCVDYMMKKKVIPEFNYDARLPEFSNKSRGLGMNYIRKNYGYHKADLTRNYVKLGNVKVPMPRIYKDYVYNEQEKAEQAILAGVSRREEKTMRRKEIKQRYREIEKSTRENIKFDLLWEDESKKMQRALTHLNKKSNRDVKNNSN